MTKRTRSICGAVILLALFGAMPDRAEAHEKWFVGETGGLRWDLFIQPLPLALVGTVFLATLLGGLLWRVRGRGFLPGPEARTRPQPSRKCNGTLAGGRFRPPAAMR